MSAISVQGVVVNDHDVAAEYSDLQKLTVSAIRLGKEPVHFERTLVCFTVTGALVTSCYIPVQIEPARLFANQTYSNAAYWFPGMRPSVKDNAFTLQSTPTALAEPHVIIGGPIDGVWYHWLVSWCPRILLLKRMRPDLFADSNVKFLVDNSAQSSSFLEVLGTMGIDLSRVTFADRNVDYLLEQAILVSFPDQNDLYPDLVREFAATVKANLGISPETLHAGRVFASRQAIVNPRRRIVNFAEVEPVLRQFDFNIVNLGGESARRQVELFDTARFVLGGHGSDLANLMFCRPGTDVLVIENARNVWHGIGSSLEQLCAIMGLNYHYIVVEEDIRDDMDYSQFVLVHTRDFIVPPAALEQRLRELGCLPR
jgi:capsular polysaccharide biosynthesis protein